MNTLRSRRPPPDRIRILALASVLGLASCATRPPVPEGAEPASGLPADAAVYVRADRTLLAEAARDLLAPADLKAVRPLLARTDRAAAALVLPGPGAGQEETARPELYGIAEGSYPAGAAAFRLRLSRDWKKDGRTLVRSDGVLRIAFADRHLLAAGTADLEPLLDRLTSPGPHPVPRDLRPYWEAPGALWFPRPGDLAGRIWGAEAPAPPARGVLFALEPEEEGGGYSGIWIFAFDSDRDARVYAPLCRLVHLAFVRAVLGEGEAAAAALDRTVWTVEGGLLRASGFPLPISSLFRVLGGFLP